MRASKQRTKEFLRRILINMERRKMDAAREAHVCAVRKRLLDSAFPQQSFVTATTVGGWGGAAMPGSSMTIR